MTLIRRHNRLQLRRGIVDLAISAVATVATFGFFYFTLRYLFFTFDADRLQQSLLPIVGAIMVLNFVTGYFAWRRDLGQSEYHGSDLFVGGISLAGGGGTVGSMLAARGAVPAYFVSQIALAAPLRLFKSLHELRLQIAEDPNFEVRLNDLLDTIVEKKRWHPAGAYRDFSAEFACLIRLDAVDFSPHKGSVKARSEFAA